MNERWEYPELRLLGVDARPGSLRLMIHLKAAGYDPLNFAFDGDHGFRYTPIGALPGQHANVPFVPRGRPDFLAGLRGVQKA